MEDGVSLWLTLSTEINFKSIAGNEKKGIIGDKR